MKTEQEFSNNGVKLYYLFRKIYKGTRTDYYATNDEQSARKLFSSVKQKTGISSLTLKTIVDKNWEIYTKTLAQTSPSTLP